MRVLFVCLGNICRSPTAHGVFAKKMADLNLQDRISVDSCGTGAWHVGEAPDGRATATAARRGYDLSSLRARQVVSRDFDEFDYILAMDFTNLSELQAHCPRGFNGHLGLFLEFAEGLNEREVPDPYYDSTDGFDHVLDLIESASDGLLKDIQRAFAD
jgi:low molecular weight protein-tyrosine phosphatase